jgi:hypothetical protein
MKGSELLLGVFINNKSELTNSMEQSPTWKANSHSASQISCLFWNLKVH